jgi:hypothetical protein
MPGRGTLLNVCGGQGDDANAKEESKSADYREGRRNLVLLPFYCNFAIQISDYLGEPCSVRELGRK